MVKAIVILELDDKFPVFELIELSNELHKVAREFRVELIYMKLLPEWKYEKIKELLTSP
jgi:hypothetical protein